MSSLKPFYSEDFSLRVIIFGGIFGECMLLRVTKFIRFLCRNIGAIRQDLCLGPWGGIKKTSKFYPCELFLLLSEMSLKISSSFLHCPKVIIVCQRSNKKLRFWTHLNRSKYWSVYCKARKINEIISEYVKNRIPHYCNSRPRKQ